ncbi:MAG: zinc dependent phospholipase C family protein [Nitrospirales bacterium]|nr:zinc dependent phospholipase C family protein [Nitrospirales bacterium]
MPATFAHCLIASRAIDSLMQGSPSAHAAILAEKNSFAIMGATGPDYPYLTDILTTGVLKIGHTWANRMHYEGVSAFVREGIARLAAMDRKSDAFAIRLAWFCGYVSHAIADSYVHPVVNSIVHGPYIFTHSEHGRCELVQDIYIFRQETGEDIVSSNPRNGVFGYLRILDECSDPADNDRIHPEIQSFWTDLLKAAHPYAQDHFDSIDPDKWHHNYKGRVNFVVDPGAIFRHILGMAGFNYKKASELTAEEREKYIEKVRLPNGKEDHYDNVFRDAIGKVVSTWKELFAAIDQGSPSGVADDFREWNLDTGVDESRIDLWK